MQQRKETVVQIVHRQKKPINFRPHTHHRILTTVDDLFILRYTSYQHYIELLDQWKIEIYESFLQKPLEKIGKYIDSVRKEDLNGLFVSIFNCSAGIFSVLMAFLH